MTVSNTIMDEFKEHVAKSEVSFILLSINGYLNLIFFFLDKFRWC